MELNLHRLWIFMQVVEHGGFSAAAQKLFMSQPSVSNQVRQLERSVQATLVDRSGPRVRATAEGEVLFEYAKRVFLLADEAVAAVRQVSDLRSGKLIVGGTTTVGTYLLPSLFAEFQRRYPRIECDIDVGNNVQIRGRLLNGEIGLAVVAGTPGAPQLVTEPILKERLVLIAAPDHPLAGKVLEPSVLAEERFLLREQGSQTRDLQEAALLQWDIPQVVRSDVSGPEAIKQCVTVQLGVSLISEHAVVDEVQDGRLVILEVDPPLKTRPISVTHRRDRLLSPAERAFIDLLRDVHDWPSELPHEDDDLP